MTIDLGSNDPSGDIDIGDKSLTSDATDNADDNDLSSFDPLTQATLADNWLLIASNALQVITITDSTLVM
jgi:hypothetical protein